MGEVVVLVGRKSGRIGESCVFVWRLETGVGVG